MCTTCSECVADVYALHDFFPHVSTLLCQIRDLVTDAAHHARLLYRLMLLFYFVRISLVALLEAFCAQM